MNNIMTKTSKYTNKEKIINYLVSIVIPVYNSGPTIKRCLNSVLTQTYTNIEIVIVDDKSTDVSSKICDEYALRYKQIRVIHKDKNEGLLLARKTGVIESYGYYILNVDSDDYIEPNMIESLMEEDFQSDTDIITSGFFKQYQDGSVFEITDEVPVGKYDLKKDDTFFNCFMYDGTFLRKGLQTFVWCKLIKREILLKVYDGIDLRLNMYEDALAIYRALGFAQNIRITKRIYYHYCVHNMSMSRIANENYYIDINNVYKAVKSVFAEHKFREILIRQLDLFMIYQSYAGICEYFPVSKRFVPPYFVFDTSIIPSNSRVVLYGAGRVGKSFYKVCMANEIMIALWVDKNYSTYDTSKYLIDSVESINDTVFDYILIAIKSESSSNKIKKQLISEFRIPETKIICPKIGFELDKYIEWDDFNTKRV